MDVHFTKPSRPEVLAALYNGSKAQGMSWMAFVPEPMTLSQAQKIIEKYTDKKGIAWFDYLQGRVMKVGIGDNTVYRADLYDRDIGTGRCQEIIDELEEKYLKLEEAQAE